MASVSANLHIHKDDKPFIDRLEGGSIAVWIEGEHRGPTLIGSDESLAKLRDAIDAFLSAQAVPAEAA